MDLGNSILKCEFIHEAFKVICNNNLKRPREFDDMGTRSIKAKIVKLRRFFVMFKKLKEKQEIF